MARGKVQRPANAEPVEGPWELPDGWRWERLGEVADIIAGQSPASADCNREGAGLPFFQGKADFGHDFPTARTWCERPQKIAEAEDLLISVRAPVGPTNFAAERCGIGRGLAAIRPKTQSARWLRYWLFASTEKLLERATGTTFEAITGDVLRSHVCPVPPAPVEAQLVQRIDELFFEVDDGEAALERARADLATWRKALLKAAVTGELTADWRAANPPTETGADLLARILAERRTRWHADPRNRGKRYVEPTGADTDGFRRLSDGWTWASLDQLCTVITSGSRAWSRYYGRGRSTFIMAQNVRCGRYDGRFRQRVDPPEGDAERARTAVARDDLLLTIVGANTGDLCRFDIDPDDHYVCQSVALMRLSDRSFAPIVEAFFANDYGRKLQMEGMIYGAGRPHLSFDQIKTLAVPVPPNAERLAIAKELAAIASTIEAAASTMPAARITASTLRQSILAAAFRGELVG